MIEERKAFLPADILIPKENAEFWSVVACDQFEAQPEYWEETKRIAEGKPSAINMIIPEAFLETSSLSDDIRAADECMQKYLDSGVFRCVEDSFIYVERTLNDGRVRRGIVGKIDLECYDYTDTAESLLRASEETVVSRLPVRIRLREDAALEMPHTMVLFDDVNDIVMAHLTEYAKTAEKVYDFKLMQNGGSIRGWRVSGDEADKVTENLYSLVEPETYKARYGETEGSAVLFVMGDGNHSLAAAKVCWERIKEGLSREERENHTARYSLVELVNIHEKALDFEPIHRAVFGIDREALYAAIIDRYPQHEVKEPFKTITCVVSDGEDRKINIPAEGVGMLIDRVQNVIDSFVQDNGGKVDYIHGDDTLRKLVDTQDELGILLPVFEKGELFDSVIKSGVFPRKSFSMGNAEDKRYYLECRKII